MYTKTGLSALAIAGLTLGVVGMLTSSSGAAPANCIGTSNGVSAPAPAGSDGSAPISNTTPSTNGNKLAKTTTPSTQPGSGGTAGPVATTPSAGSGSGSGSTGSGGNGDLLDVNGGTNAPTPRLAATLAGRRPLRIATDPVIVPMPTPRRRAYRPLRPAAVAIAASAMVFGGLATAGALPNPVQRTSAQLGSHVGIHLPGRATHHPAPVRPVTKGTGGSGTPGSPVSRPKPKRATPTTTRSTVRRTPTTTPAAIAPRPPTFPTLPSLPLPIPVPRPTLPVKTPPGLGLTLPSLPVTIPTAVIHH